MDYQPPRTIPPDLPPRAVRAVMTWLAQALASADVLEPRMEAEVLLMEVLGVSRAYLYAHPEQEVSLEHVERLADLFQRRARGEPLAYLTGHKEFYGLDFIVRPGVLIPRPETELLIERAIALAGGYPRGARLALADVGTGCGAIAVALALNLPNAHVYATDTSAAVIAVAAENVRRYGLGSRVTLLQGDLLEPVPELLDLVVANLPYVRSDELPYLQREVRHEPREALDGGPDGLRVIGRFLQRAPAWVKPRGAVLVEMDHRQAATLISMAREYFPGARVTVYKDLAGLDRVCEVSREEEVESRK